MEIFFGDDCVGFGELALEEGDAVLIVGDVVFFGVDVFEGGDHLLSFAFELFPSVIFQPLLKIFNFRLESVFLLFKLDSISLVVLSQLVDLYCVVFSEGVPEELLLYEFLFNRR